MKTLRLTTAFLAVSLAIAILGALLAACGTSDSHASGPDAETYGVTVPTESEAKQHADATIDEANADAEFQKLMKEIEADAESDG